MHDASFLPTARAGADPIGWLSCAHPTGDRGSDDGLGTTLRLTAKVRSGNAANAVSVAPPVADQSAFVLVEEQADARSSIQTYIASCFAQKYGARVPGFMPRLFSLRDADGRLQGAVGLRRGDEALYLEQYLDVAIQRVIERHVGSTCDRRQVSEVGHLCGAFPGVVRVLIDLLTKRLADENAGWVTFTGTPRLRNAFARLGLMPIDVGPALAEAVSASDRSAWGAYYEESPRVFIGSVPLGHRILGASPAGSR